MTDPTPDLRGQLGDWELTVDGPAVHGAASTVLPVRTSDGTPAVLKIATAPEAEFEHLVLRRWGGVGAVRLLRADPHRRALLLERLGTQTLETLWDVEACEVVAASYRHLHVPALPQLRCLTTDVEQWVADLETLPRSAPVPRRLVEQAITVGRDLAVKPADAVVLHGDLHYRKMLAADREPWLAIGPKPVNGDPHYELAPMLWHRWNELEGNVRAGVRTRFHALVDAGELDEARARAWVEMRVMRETVRVLTAPRRDASDDVTKYVAIAKAVQD